MSHFSLAVFTKDSNFNLDEIMEPYDENKMIAPYILVTKEEAIQNKRKFYESQYQNCFLPWQKDPMAYESRHSAEHIKDIKTLPELMKQSDEQIYQNVISDYTDEEIDADGNILSTYNPNSKWDWYEVGGRWRGLLLLKPGIKGPYPESSLKTQSGEFYRADAAYTSEVDFERISAEYAATLRPYEEAMKDSFFKEEYMRMRFPTEEEYIERHKRFKTFAVLTPDGVWHAPGEMGWFGVSSDTPEGERNWDFGYYNNFIKPAIVKQWYMTIVDCHI